jgi:hypothetical protein
MNIRLISIFLILLSGCASNPIKRPDYSLLGATIREKWIQDRLSKLEDRVDHLEKYTIQISTVPYECDPFMVNDAKTMLYNNSK